MDRRRSITLQRALLGALAGAMLAGFVPAGIALDRRLARALEDRAREDLTLAPRLLADRMAAGSDAMMMHAKDFAHVPGLGDALVSGDRDRASAVVDAARASLGGDPVIVDARGASWAGPPVAASVLAETRAGRMPVVVARAGPAIHRLALAPVEQGGRWVGAAGVVTPFDEGVVGALSGLTRSGVTIVTTDGVVVATTLDSTAAREIAALTGRGARADVSHPIATSAGRTLAIAAPLADAGMVVFTRVVAEELTVLPSLRRIAALSAGGALLVAVVLGAVLATLIARPVRELSDAASALTEGRFDAPLPASRIDEVSRVAATFDAMRLALAARLEELRQANDALSDRNARLTALQGDLMQRDRLAANGRLVLHMAHEIRNPVASLRNCLELIRRRVEHDPEAREFADLAIDELLRMHELAERMLDLNRPRASGALACQPLVVARDVAKLADIGSVPNAAPVRVTGDEHVLAAIAPDALKQVLLNLIQNAREAMAAAGARGEIEVTVEPSGIAAVAIEISDRGPGIAPEILGRIFDPFFTTKGAVHGVGLGLFVAEGLVRTAGGRITAKNRPGGGTTFRLELPVATPSAIADVMHAKSEPMS